ncbi:N-acetylmuramoyl-L-alanine amidase [Sulfurospirillum deleyianum]|uniref:N-acetylmuramoyl-L-alanine amidase n=1 Tax=Sulfurospirillum deleyianum (strain ATCC 51133 / DSM 6946 / 5175) TaxID=525898 RepID=D1B069_SULD5|nr:N-acetylmuramoyl-L-alanine amidase [Sulfurospirillum deleyianum DSM 6946]
MGKRIKVFFLLMVTCMALFGAPNYMQQLEQYDAQLKGATHDEVLRIFHGLKSVYIQSIVKGDDSLKKETLERLIATSKQLKFDSSKYESELATMSKESSSSASKTQAVSSTVRKENMNQPSEASAFSPTKKVQESTRAFLSNQTTTTLPKSFKGKNVLQSVETTEDEVILHFGSSVVEKSVKVFILKSAQSYKKVIDIPAVILNAPLAIKTPQKLNSLRISQYNNDLIRVVIDAPRSLDTYVSALDGKVILSLDKKPQLTQPSKKESSPEPMRDVEKKVPLVASKVPSSDLPTPTSSPNRHKTIVIDAGHGGKDAGAIGYKKNMEKHLVLEMALQLGKELKSRGYKVFYTRQKDVFINLRDRTKVANDKNADLFISLHANAAPTEAKKLSMKGLETFFLSPDRSERSKNVAALENQSDMEEMDYYSKETFLNVFNREKIILSNKAAIDVQSSMLKQVKKRYAVEDGGVREAPFWVLVGATMPSVLIEIGYITNPEESMNMHNPSYQKLIVEGISDGLDRYFTNNP